MGVADAQVARAKAGAAVQASSEPSFYRQHAAKQLARVVHLSREGVADADAGWRVMSDIARYHHEVMDQGRRGDLFV